MNPEIKAKWIAALRSGNYGQCAGKLTNGAAYCCLGVLQELAGFDEQEGRGLLDLKAASKIGLPYKIQDALAEMNDSGKTFAEIADHIEQTL